MKKLNEVDISKESDIELILRRRSHRFYETMDLKEKDVSRIKDIINQVKKSFEFLGKELPIRVEYVKRSRPFRGAVEFLVGVVPKRFTSFHLINISCMLHKVVLKLYQMDVVSCYHGGQFGPVITDYISNFDVQNDHIAVMCTIGYKIEKTPPRKERKKNSSLFFEKDLKTEMKPDINMTKVMECLKWSPSCKNNQPWKVLKIGKCYHVLTEMIGKDDPYYNFIDNGIGKASFEIAVRELKIEGRFSIDAPTGLVAPQNFVYLYTFTSK